MVLDASEKQLGLVGFRMLERIQTIEVRFLLSRFHIFFLKVLGCPYVLSSL
jgi:hypothetical protein